MFNLLLALIVLCCMHYEVLDSKFPFHNHVNSIFSQCIKLCLSLHNLPLLVTRMYVSIIFDSS
jgi:hypothetical protein